MPRAIHFGIAARDTSRVSRFYADVFGWKMNRWGEGEYVYTLISTGDDKSTGIPKKTCQRS